MSFLRRKLVYNTKEIFSASLTKTSCTLCFELRMVQTRHVPLSKMDEVPHRYFSIFINNNNNSNNSSSSSSSSSNVSEKKRMLNIDNTLKRMAIWLQCSSLPLFFVCKLVHYP